MRKKCNQIVQLVQRVDTPNEKEVDSLHWNTADVALVPRRRGETPLTGELHKIRLFI